MERNKEGRWTSSVSGGPSATPRRPLKEYSSAAMERGKESSSETPKKRKSLGLPLHARNPDRDRERDEVFMEDAQFDTSEADKDNEKRRLQEKKSMDLSAVPRKARTAMSRRRPSEPLPPVPASDGNPFCRKLLSCSPDIEPVKQTRKGAMELNTSKIQQDNSSAISEQDVELASALFNLARMGTASTPSSLEFSEEDDEDDNGDEDEDEEEEEEGEKETPAFILPSSSSSSSPEILAASSMAEAVPEGKQDEGAYYGLVATPTHNVDAWRVPDVPESNVEDKVAEARVASPVVEMETESTHTILPPEAGKKVDFGKAFDSTLKVEASARSSQAVMSSCSHEIDLMVGSRSYCPLVSSSQLDANPQVSDSSMRHDMDKDDIAVGPKQIIETGEEQEEEEIRKENEEINGDSGGQVGENKNAEEKDRKVAESELVGKERENEKGSSGATPFLPSSMRASAGVAGWPGSMPSLGCYPPSAMAGPPRWPAGTSFHGPTSSSSSPNQVSQVTCPDGQASLKRCTGHVYIAQFIRSHQQTQRNNPFWTAAYNNPMMGFYGPRPYNNLNAPLLHADMMYGNGVGNLMGSTSARPNGYISRDTGINSGLPCDMARAGIPVSKESGVQTHQAGAAVGIGNCTSIAAQAQYLQAMMQQMAFPFFPPSPFGPMNGPPGHISQHQVAQYMAQAYYYNSQMAHHHQLQQMPSQQQVQEASSLSQCGHYKPSNAQPQPSSSLNPPSQQIRAGASSSAPSRRQMLIARKEREANRGSDVCSTAESKLHRDSYNSGKQQHHHHPCANKATTCGVEMLPPNPQGGRRTNNKMVQQQLEASSQHRQQLPYTPLQPASQSNTSKPFSAMSMKTGSLGFTSFIRTMAPPSSTLHGLSESVARSRLQGLVSKPPGLLSSRMDGNRSPSQAATVDRKEKGTSEASFSLPFSGSSSTTTSFTTARPYADHNSRPAGMTIPMSFSTHISPPLLSEMRGGYPNILNPRVMDFDTPLSLLNSASASTSPNTQLIASTPVMAESRSSLNLSSSSEKQHQTTNPTPSRKHKLSEHKI